MSSSSSPLPPLIGLEEHFISTTLPASVQELFSEQVKNVPSVLEKLQDLDTARLADMDTAQISFQVLSHAAGACGLPPSESQKINDEIYAATQRHPSRFAAFATLPMTDPPAAAEELRRCVKDLGFVGALIDNHLPDGTHYDAHRFRPVFAAAQELDVPIYLHPTWPSEAMNTTLYSGAFPAAAGASMGTSGFGWHADTGLHVLKLFAAGLFDELPRLKIVVGHFGEMLPFMLERVYQLSPRWGERKRAFKQVYDENVWVTTSGVWGVAPMACVLRNTAVERVLFSVDYPFAANEDGERFMVELRESGLVSEEELGKIAFGNAQALLGIRAPRRG